MLISASFHSEATLPCPSRHVKAIIYHLYEAMFPVPFLLASLRLMR